MQAYHAIITISKLESIGLIHPNAFILRVCPHLYMKHVERTLLLHIDPTNLVLIYKKESIYDKFTLPFSNMSHCC